MSSVPKQIRDITPDWLTEVLPADIRGGAAITAVHATTIGEGVGFLSQLARLDLSYDGPGGPPTMIAKLPTLHEGMRQLAVSLGFFAHELGFYRHFAGKNPGVRIPACYYAAGDPSHDFVMLLEDMAPARPGDQIASCTLDEAELAITEIAKFHARWWQSPEIDGHDWLPGPGHPYFDMLEFGYRVALPAFEEKFAPMVEPEVTRLALQLADSYRGFVSNLMGRQRTLVHQDFRLDNMFFASAEGGPPFTLIDWQICQQSVGPVDIAYFLAGNMSREDRRANEARFIERYWETLREHGVESYTLEDCWTDYRLGVAQLLFYLVTGAPDFNMDDWNERGQLLFDRMYRGYASAIMDHPVAEILDSLPA